MIHEDYNVQAKHRHVTKKIKFTSSNRILTNKQRNKQTNIWTDGRQKDTPHLLPCFTYEWHAHTHTQFGEIILKWT
jgi:hypothetical protein